MYIHDLCMTLIFDLCRWGGVSLVSSTQQFSSCFEYMQLIMFNKKVGLMVVWDLWDVFANMRFLEKFMLRR